MARNQQKNKHTPSNPRYFVRIYTLIFLHVAFFGVKSEKNEIDIFMYQILRFEILLPKLIIRLPHARQHKK